MTTIALHNYTVNLAHSWSSPSFLALHSHNRTTSQFHNFIFSTASLSGSKFDSPATSIPTAVLIHVFPLYAKPCLPTDIHYYNLSFHGWLTPHFQAFTSFISFTFFTSIISSNSPFKLHLS